MLHSLLPFFIEQLTSHGASYPLSNIVVRMDVREGLRTYMEIDVQGTLWFQNGVLLSCKPIRSLILRGTLLDQFHYKDEETEAKRGERTYLRPTEKQQLQDSV